MRPTTFPQFNFNLGAGNNPNTDDLPIAISESTVKEEEGVAFLVSKYKLEPMEIDRVVKTGEIWLAVMTTKPRQDTNGKLHLTNTMPPVLLTAENPFEDGTYPARFKAYDADLFI